MISNTSDPEENRKMFDVVSAWLALIKVQVLLYNLSLSRKCVCAHVHWFLVLLNHFGTSVP